MMMQVVWFDGNTEDDNDGSKGPARYTAEERDPNRTLRMQLSQAAKLVLVPYPSGVKRPVVQMTNPVGESCCPRNTTFKSDYTMPSQQER